MSPIVKILNRFLLCATALVFAQQALAAVLILEGGAPPPSAPPPLSATPGTADRRDDPPPRVQPDQSPSAAPGESGILSTLTPPTRPPEPPAPPAAAPAPPAVAVAPSVPAMPSVPMAPVNPGIAKVSNAAEVSLEMLPGQTVSVGSQVSFRVTSRKAGYLVLVDMDATGHLAQIYPNPAALARTSRTNGNYIKPGSSFAVPLATDPYAGVRYVVSPPNGQAMIIAILSAQPVQILDLPDMPATLNDASERLAYLSKWMNELRIPDEGSQLREAKWSLNAKSYTIQ